MFAERGLTIVGIINRELLARFSLFSPSPSFPFYARALQCIRCLLKLQLSRTVVKMKEVEMSAPFPLLPSVQ
jgi:hypothetical protein